MKDKVWWVDVKYLKRVKRRTVILCLRTPKSDTLEKQGYSTRVVLNGLRLETVSLVTSKSRDPVLVEPFVYEMQWLNHRFLTVTAPNFFYGKRKIVPKILLQGEMNIFPCVREDQINFPSYRKWVSTKVRDIRR